MYPDDAATQNADDASPTAEAEASADATAEGSDDEPSVEQLRAELEKERNARKQLLSERTNVERERAELAAERARLSQPPTVTAGDPTAAARAQLERDWNLVQQMDDPNVDITSEHIRAQNRMLKATLQAQDMSSRETGLRIDLQSVTDAEDRQAVEKMVRSGEATVATAKRIVAMERKLKELESGDADKEDELDTKRKRAAATPEMRSRPVTAAEVASRPTRLQYDAMIEKLNSDPDPGAVIRKRDYIRKYRDKIRES